MQWLCCVQQLHPGLLWGLRMVPSELHIHKQLWSIWTAVGERYVLQTQHKYEQSLCSQTCHTHLTETLSHSNTKLIFVVLFLACRSGMFICAQSLHKRNLSLLMWHSPAGPVYLWPGFKGEWFSIIYGQNKHTMKSKSICTYVHLWLALCSFVSYTAHTYFTCQLKIVYSYMALFSSSRMVC